MGPLSELSYGLKNISRRKDSILNENFAKKRIFNKNSYCNLLFQSMIFPKIAFFSKNRQIRIHLAAEMKRVESQAPEI